LELNFRQPFGRAHHARRVDRFVGGNQDERFRPMADGQPREQPGADDIVAHGFRGLPLHHVHMFVRRGVKNDRRPIAGKNEFHAFFVQNIADQRQDHRTQGCFVQLLLDQKQAAFGLFHHQHSLGIERGDLPAELAADAAARPGHHHDFPLHEFANRRGIEIDRVASEQVLHLDRSDAARFHPAGREFLERREGFHFEINLGREEHDFPDASGRGRLASRSRSCRCRASAFRPQSTPAAQGWECHGSVRHASTDCRRKRPPA